VISLWLWPLLALGADIESPEPRMPDPRKPTLFEIEGDYSRITALYGKKYCLTRIVILATKVKKHIEATISDPIQQNLRWRYITFLASCAQYRDNNSFNQPYELANIFERFSEGQPDWLWPTIHVIGGLIHAFNEEGGKSWYDTSGPVVAIMTPRGILAVELLDRSVYMALHEDDPLPADQKKANILLSAPGKPLEILDLHIPLETFLSSERGPHCFAIISEEISEFESLVISYHGKHTKGTFSIDFPYSKYLHGSRTFNFRATWVQKPVQPWFKASGPELGIKNGGAILESALHILAGENPPNRSSTP
jgi:hypothetical protein